MYGNGVSASDAVKLYMACQGPHVRLRKMAEAQMYGCYMQCAMFGTRNIFYNNMKRKCVVVVERGTRGTGGNRVQLWTYKTILAYGNQTENPGVENEW